MIAKLIVHASTREQAIARMRRALGEYMINGIKTTIPLQLEIMQNKDFIAGKYDTGFLERMLAERGGKKKK
jgi:acetyl-CoA carboxylase biotin carboxylase subunit